VRIARHSGADGAAFFSRFITVREKMGIAGLFSDARRIYLVYAFTNHIRVAYRMLSDRSAKIPFLNIIR